MRAREILSMVVLGLGCCMAFAASGADAPVSKSTGTINSQQIAAVKAGISTKNQIQALLGAPWRVVQFNDCGMAMPGQADETWDYRGTDSNGTYRLHIEFNDQGVAHLVARIPDNVPDGKGTPAQTAPAVMAHNMKM